jgi:hypothetical protein
MRRAPPIRPQHRLAVDLEDGPQALAELPASFRSRVAQPVRPRNAVTDSRGLASARATSQLASQDAERRRAHAIAACARLAAPASVPRLKLIRIKDASSRGG